MPPKNKSVLSPKKSINNDEKVASGVTPIEVAVVKLEEKTDIISDDNSDIEETSSSSDELKVEQVEKDKKAKKLWPELMTDLNKLLDDSKENEKEYKELSEKMRANEKLKNDLARQRNKLFIVFSKAHDDEIKKVIKNRPKRKGSKDSGFNKEQEVPIEFVTYLGLQQGIKMARPKVMSALNQKFKDDGLKNGQTTTLDKKTAKLLGVESGRVIEFTEFQTFLKEIYDRHTSKTNVVTL